MKLGGDGPIPALPRSGRCLTRGDHRLVVRVANSMANEFLGTPELERALVEQRGLKRYITGDRRSRLDPPVHRKGCRAVVGMTCLISVRFATPAPATLDPFDTPKGRLLAS